MHGVGLATLMRSGTSARSIRCRRRQIPDPVIRFNLSCAMVRAELPSGASAIIAGAAASVQAMNQANRGYRFSPRQLRAILADQDQG